MAPETARALAWRALATLADIGQASLVGRIPKAHYDITSAAATRLRSNFRLEGKTGQAI